MPFQVDLPDHVRAMMRHLNPADLDRVQTVLTRLRDGTIFELTDPTDIRRIEDPSELPGTYLLKVDESLRAIFTMEPTRITVQDMFGTRHLRQPA